MEGPGPGPPEQVDARPPPPSPFPTSNSVRAAARARRACALVRLRADILRSSPSRRCAPPPGHGGTLAGRRHPDAGEHSRGVGTRTRGNTGGVGTRTRGEHSRVRGGHAPRRARGRVVLFALGTRARANFRGCARARRACSALVRGCESTRALCCDGMGKSQGGPGSLGDSGRPWRQADAAPAGEPGHHRGRVLGLVRRGTRVRARLWPVGIYGIAFPADVTPRDGAAVPKLGCSTADMTFHSAIESYLSL